MSDFKEGDLVKTKADNSPQMTIGQIDGDIIYCNWFVDGKRESTTFKASELEKVN